MLVGRVESRSIRVIDAAVSARAKRGEQVGLADGEHDARHNAALHATYHALKAVIPPGIVPATYALCDRGDGSPVAKEDAKQRWKWTNATHIPDIARISTPLFPPL